MADQPTTQQLPTIPEDVKQDLPLDVPAPSSLTGGLTPPSQAKPTLDIADLRNIFKIVDHLQTKGTFTIQDLQNLLPAYSALEKYTGATEGQLKDGSLGLIQNSHLLTMLQALALGLNKGKFTMNESKEVVAVYTRVEALLK